MDDELGDDGEAADPDVEKDVPEVVLKGGRIFQPGANVIKLFCP